MYTDQMEIIIRMIILIMICQELELALLRREKDQYVIHLLGLLSTGNLFLEMAELLKTLEKDSVRVRSQDLTKLQLEVVNLSVVLILLSLNFMRVIRLFSNVHLTMLMEEHTQFHHLVISLFHFIQISLLK